MTLSRLIRENNALKFPGRVPISGTLPGALHFLFFGDGMNKKTESILRR